MNPNNTPLLGTVNFSTQPGTTVTIFNALTQKEFGRIPKRYVSYDAVDTSMKYISDIVRRVKDMDILMPKIGAGLGGGDWNIIESIIKHNFKDLTVKVYEL